MALPIAHPTHWPGTFDLRPFSCNARCCIGNAECCTTIGDGRIQPFRGGIVKWIMYSSNEPPVRAPTSSCRSRSRAMSIDAG